MSSAKLLVVEDQAVIAADLASQLARIGYTVCGVAASGDEALALAREHRPELVLMDIRIQGQMDGIQVAEILRREQDVPVIFLTAHSDEATFLRARAAAPFGFLLKPFAERELQLNIDLAIERHRRQAEIDSIQAHQLQFKDEFLSNVSHELRSPLNAIYQFVTILADGLAGEVKEEQREYLEMTLTNVRQLQSMIDDLLEVTRAQAGKLTIELQSTSASDGIVYALNTLRGAAKAKEIMLTSEIREQLPEVCADPTRVRQILIILLDNAIKFTPVNGAVKVQARVFEKDSSLVLLEVSDSGCGIDRELTERIFERLFQASDAAVGCRRGLGLGLYICRELVTRQGGKVWATNSPAGGAILSFTLPVFSLSNLILPALRSSRRAEGPLTLVVTDISSPSGWPSIEKRSKHCRDVRHVLQACTNSDLDILLPKFGSAGATELFFILAATDAIGGEAITQRIREKFNGMGREESGLTLATHHRPVEVSRRDVGESIDNHIEKVAAAIRNLINEVMSSREVGDGKQKDSRRG